MFIFQATKDKSYGLSNIKFVDLKYFNLKKLKFCRLV